MFLTYIVVMLVYKLRFLYPYNFDIAGGYLDRMGDSRADILYFHATSFEPFDQISKSARNDTCSSGLVIIVPCMFKMRVSRDSI